LVPGFDGVHDLIEIDSPDEVVRVVPGWHFKSVLWGDNYGKC
jgi:hypothetical protein